MLQTGSSVYSTVKWVFDLKFEYQGENRSSVLLSSVLMP